MPYIKKLLFGFFFLITFISFHFFFFPLFTTYDWVFGFSQEILTLLFGSAFLLLLSAMCFLIFAALSQNVKYGLPIIILGSLVPLIFSQNSLSLVLISGYSVSLGLFYYLIVKNVNSYLSFSPNQLFAAPTKTLTTLFILVVCLGFYLSINSIIKQDGFKVPETILPDALIEQVIQSQSAGLYKGDKYLAQLPTLTPEQIQLLRQNPEVLKQYGVDPAILDQFEKPGGEPSPASTTNKSNDKPTTLPQTSPVQVSPTSESPINTTALVKNMVFDQIHSVAKQYEYLVAPLLALIVWSLFAFANFFLFLLINPLLWMIFLILEKSRFIRLVKSTRIVKRLVV